MKFPVPAYFIRILPLPVEVEQPGAAAPADEGDESPDPDREEQAHPARNDAADQAGDQADEQVALILRPETLKGWFVLIHSRLRSVAPLKSDHLAEDAGKGAVDGLIVVVLRQQPDMAVLRE